MILSSDATFEVRLHRGKMVERTMIGEIKIPSNDDFKSQPIDNNICGDDSNIASCIQLFVYIVEKHSEKLTNNGWWTITQLIIQYIFADFLVLPNLKYN